MAEQIKDEIVDDLFGVRIIRSKRQKVGESLGSKFRKTWVNETRAVVDNYPCLFVILSNS